MLEIKNKIDYLLFKVAKHEHEDSLSNIIESFKNESSATVKTFLKSTF